MIDRGQPLMGVVRPILAEGAPLTIHVFGQPQAAAWLAAILHRDGPLVTGGRARGQFDRQPIVFVRVIEPISVFGDGRNVHPALADGRPEVEHDSIDPIRHDAIADGRLALDRSAFVANRKLKDIMQNVDAGLAWIGIRKRCRLRDRA
jgi:hypothetical protein